MYKLKDFKKGCPVCHAVSRSLTKKKCDFCKAKLETLSDEYESKFGVGILEWKFKTKEDKEYGKYKNI